MEDRMQSGSEKFSNIKRVATQSGFDVKPTYKPEDIVDLDYERDLGDPGHYPYTRGRFPQGYRARLWGRNVIAGFSTPQESNDRYQFLIKECQTTALRIAPDYPTQMGLDPDHPLAVWDVGASGSSQYCLAKTELMFENISLDGLAIDSATGPPWGSVNLYAQLIALAKRRGTDPAKLRGSLVNDCLHCFFCDLSVSQPIEVGWRLQIDSMEYSTQITPNFSPCAPCGYDLRESGADTIEEVAIVLAERIASIDAVVARGVPFEKIAPRVVLALASDVDFFETICKLRAARRLWARIAKERYGINENTPGICPVTNMTGAAWSTYRQQPILNVARNTIEMLAAVMAGCQSIEGRPYDEPLFLPTVQAHGLNAQIHLLIAQESGVPLVADPLGGSYYVEALTTRIEKEVIKYMKKIEEKGGIYQAAKQGWLREELHRRSVERMLEVDNGTRPTVGVNMLRFPKELEVPVPQFRIERKLDKMASEVQDCRKYKETRDEVKVSERLSALYRMTREGKNILSGTVEAYEVGATQGEVLGVIREGLGFKFDPFDMIKRPDFIKYE